MKNILLLLTSLAILASVSGCDGSLGAKHESVYFVESYQIAAQPLRPVRLTRTAPVDAVYDTTALAVRGADVHILLLAEDGSVERTYPLVETRPGFYEPESDDLVLPLRTYRLEAVIGEDRVSATTVVPDTFSLARINTERAIYQGDEQIEFVMTRSTYPGRQTVFMFTSEALDPRADQLTPIAEHLYEEEEVTLDELRLTTSPPLNEANYTVNADGTLTVPMPWLMVAFYGPQRVSAQAIDDNMLDFIRSLQVQQGGSTLSPGEIPNVLDHVEGGSGLFASYAMMSYEVFIERNPDEGSATP